MPYFSPPPSKGYPHKDRPADQASGKASKMSLDRYAELAEDEASSHPASSWRSKRHRVHKGTGREYHQSPRPGSSNDSRRGRSSKSKNHHELREEYYPSDSRGHSLMDVDYSPPGFHNDRKTEARDGPERPSSRNSTSSMGSVDSGVSHPPNTGRKKKKAVTMSMEDVENWRKERDEAQAGFVGRRNPEIRCQYCNREFDRFDQLQIHWSSQHHGAYRWSCQQLPALLDYPCRMKDLREEHMEGLHDWNSHCQLCDEIYYDLSDEDCQLHSRRCAEAHQIAEHNVGSCDIPLGFWSLEEFREHLYDDHNVEPDTAHMQNILSICQLHASDMDSLVVPKQEADKSRQKWLKDRHQRDRNSAMFDVMEE